MQSSPIQFKEELSEEEVPSPLKCEESSDTVVTKPTEDAGGK